MSVIPLWLCRDCEFGTRKKISNAVQSYNNVYIVRYVFYNQCNKLYPWCNIHKLENNWVKFLLYNVYCTRANYEQTFRKHVHEIDRDLMHKCINIHEQYTFLYMSSMYDQGYYLHLLLEDSLSVSLLSLHSNVNIFSRLPEDMFVISVYHFLSFYLGAYE